jgi:hypothetical protein
LEDRDVGGSMGSEWILGSLAERVLSGFNWLRIGASVRDVVIRLTWGTMEQKSCFYTKI